MAKNNTGFLKWVLYWAARGVIATVSRIPIKTSFRMGSCFGSALWRILPKRRKIVEKNLQIAQGWCRAQDPDFDGSNLSSREVFRRTCANLVAGFSFGRMQPDQMKQHLEIEGIEKVHQALAQQRGAILILAHMGPWELLTALAALGPEWGINAQMGAIYRPLDNQYLDDWVRSVRQQNHTTLFSRKDGFHKPAAFIKDGNILGILSDQRASRGPRVPFFGVEVPTTPLPGLLHQRTEAPLISLAVETIGLARWKLTVREVKLPPTGQDRASEKVALATATNQTLETNLSSSLNDVFWFHNRFR